MVFGPYVLGDGGLRAERLDAAFRHFQFRQNRLDRLLVDAPILVQGAYVFPHRLHRQPLPDRERFVFGQRRVDVFDLALQVADLGQQAPFEQLDLIEIALLLCFERQQRAQFPEPVVFAAERGLVSSRFGVEAVHLRLETEVL